MAAFMPKREQLNKHMQVRLRSIGEGVQPAFPTPEEALQVFATTQVRSCLRNTLKCLNSFRSCEDTCRGAPRATASSSRAHRQS